MFENPESFFELCGTSFDVFNDPSGVKLPADCQGRGDVPVKFQ